MLLIHRDADNQGRENRLAEIERACSARAPSSKVVPIIPVRMTEAWLLLDEVAIRTVAGNPRGRDPLPLPKTHEVERVADPKALLRQCLLAAGDASGRRRQTLAKRFNQHRRELLGRLEPTGDLALLPSWQQLLRSVDSVCSLLIDRR